MMLRGIVDDVDYFIGMHLGTSLFKLGQVCCETGGFLATTKLDAIFTGHPAHAGMTPEKGRNALLAAATALLNLHAISRHSQGTSRINVGVLQGGTGRNVIPDHAVLKLETRGSTSLINEYMQQEAERIIKAAALMQDVSVSIKEMGSASGCNSTPELSSRIKKIAQETGLFDEYIDKAELGGSEDISYFMEKVQQRGGKAAYLLIGTELTAGHHNSHFDFNEDVLPKAVSLLSIIAKELLAKNEQIINEK
jgi:aminobenzoyl-glutamate utilization protein A